MKIKKYTDLKVKKEELLKKYASVILNTCLKVEEQNHGKKW
mgnify:CR=1 FL=1